jgi:hypothetical protein
MSRTPARVLAVALAAATFALLVACGGGGLEAKAPTYEMGPEPQTIEEAEAEIERARAELSLTPQAQPQSTTTPTGAAEPAAAPQHAGTPSSAECPNLCRAFQSMRRAQSALCRLAGESDERCAEAKKTVAETAGRVAYCGCQ